MSRLLALLPVSALALLSLSLGGCTDLKRALGMEKVVPDEFAVVQQPPLSMPPDFSLRPPKPGAPPSQDVSPTDQARQTIFRAADAQPQAAVPDADKLTAGENQLLRQAGADKAPPDIRDTVNREAAQAPTPVEESFIDKLLFWRTPDQSAAATAAVLDPQAEARRLKGGSPAASTAAATPPSSADNAAPATAAAVPSAAPADLVGPPIIERRRDPSTG